MSDRDRGLLGDDEDRLPWLEPVDDEDEEGGPGAGRLIAAVIAGLLVIGLVVGGVMWMRGGNEADGSGELIAAPEGDYKVPAEGPSANGMAIEGEGDAAFAASEGVDINAAIDVNQRPEAPLAGMTAVDAAAVRTKELPPSTAAVPAAKPAPVKQAAAAPAGPTIQLGAFGSEATANTEWSKLSRQFPALNGLARTITPVNANGKTLFRLRLTGPNAGSLCDQVKAGGKPCNVVAG